VFGLRAREALRGSREASSGAGLGGGGLERPVHSGRARAAGGASCSGESPANSGLGGTKGVRGSKVEALGCFIGAGAGEGTGSGVARRGHVGRVLGHALARKQRSNTWMFVSALVQTLVGRPNVHIMPTILCIVSSLCQGLSVLCESRVEIWSGWEDMVV
jgi:hypothetical protein